MRLLTTHYKLSPGGWPAGRRLRIAALADLHICEPWMTLDRVEKIVAATNDLRADVIVLLGDYASQHSFVSKIIPDDDWTKILGGLRAPHGVYAILGNHDWWNDDDAQRLGGGIVKCRRSLERHGIPVLENDALQLSGDWRNVWIAGLADQWAIRSGREQRLNNGNFGFLGLDDIEKNPCKDT